MNFIKDAKNQWIVVIDNKTYRFDSTHPDYIALVECVSSGNDTALVEILSVGLRVENWANGNFKFENGVLYYGQEIVHNVITDRIVDHLKQGIPCNHILKFLENLYKNPSYRAITELYKFLEHNYLPITTDGCFLGYKYVARHYGNPIVDLEGRRVVEGDFIDNYTKNSYRNNIGDTPTMARFKVDDNCDAACSDGLHVGSVQYVEAQYGLPSVIVKVNPMDVVSVPLDHNNQKVRVCSYIVVGVYEKKMDQPVVDQYDKVEDDLDDDDFSSFDDDEEDFDEDNPCEDENCEICSPKDEYTEQDSDDDIVAIVADADYPYGGNTPIVPDQVITDARQTPAIIPTGWERFIPQIGDVYPKCKYCTNDAPFWKEGGALEGCKIAAPDNDKFFYIKESK